MSEPSELEALNATLRGASMRAVEVVGQGVCLIFAAMPGDSGIEAAHQLKAAAGFDSADAAREAADALMPMVGESLRNGETTGAPGQPSLGSRCAAGLSLHPLPGETGILGLVIVGYPSPPAATTNEQLARLVSSVAMQLDHAHLRDEVRELRSHLHESQSLADQKGDELLKLSEALFSQDIELLRSNEKIGKIEKLKNDFIEKMSRELRTPLNSIIESIISVMTNETAGASQESMDCLRNALDEGTVFQRTLENILDLWCIKQGELPVEPQEVNFRELVEEAIFSVQDTLAGKPVEIEKEIASNLPIFRTDLTKINQILFLLLDNAAKFTEKGTITISAQLIGNALEFVIRDTGIGICADDQQFIFDDFYQVDDHASRRYRGAGLGLALVRDLLVLLEGDSQIMSEAGAGTAITVTVPVEIA